jgi:uncharacterized LabA/DUF88 family protein
MATERIAIVLDLENLVGLPPHGSAIPEIRRALADILEGRVTVSSVGYCIRSLQRRLAFELADLGVRVFGHTDAAADASDRLIIEHIAERLPASVTTVVIGSGDHIFAPTASFLRGRGLRIEVAARPRSLSAALYRASDRWFPVGRWPVVPTHGHVLPLAA